MLFVCVPIKMDDDIVRGGKRTNGGKEEEKGERLNYPRREVCELRSHEREYKHTHRKKK